MSKTQQPRKLTPRQEASAADTSAERLKTLAADPKLTRLVAANPNAPAELLLELSHSDDKTVRKACTSNANTPVEALLKLGAQFPEQLLENPVFDLLLLAHPGLFEELPTSTLNSLLKRELVPVGLIRWAWKHRGESTLHSLLMNPNTPVDVVEELCKSKDPEVRMAAELHCSRELPGWAKKPDADKHILYNENLQKSLIIGSTSKWERLFNSLIDCLDDSSILDLEGFLPRDLLYLLEGKAKYSNSHVFLHGLSKGKNYRTRATAASSSNALISTLTQLSGDKDAYVRYCVASNSNTPQTTLVELTRDNDSRVQEGAIANHKLPVEVLLSMSQIKRIEMILGLAQNIQAPGNVLSQLSKHEWSYVRQFVAENSGTPRGVLSYLGEDICFTVRRAVGRNGNTPTGTLIQLARDEDDNVRCSVAGNTKAPPATLINLSEDRGKSGAVFSVRIAVATNPETPNHILIRLAKDESQYVREAVARNSNTSTDALVELAKDKVPEVRSAVAENNTTPVEIVTKLAIDEQSCVRSAVARNIQTQAGDLMQLARDSESDVRLAIAKNSKTPIHSLIQLSKDVAWEVRCAALSNCQLPVELISEIRLSLIEDLIEAGCAGSIPSPGRRFLFTLPQCHANILAKNFRSRSWLERFAIAGNPSTPEPVLERMANEGNQLVRRAAKANLEQRARVAVQEPPAPEEKE